MSASAFRFDGKNVLVVGGATGMGAAAARSALELGATVTVLDVADVNIDGVTAIRVDLRDEASVNSVADQIAGPVHALLSCAGVADGTAGIMKINFISQRVLIERLHADGKLPHGSAIAMVSSVAGLGWRSNLAQVQDFLSQPGWDAMVKWVESHEGTDGYGFSKQAMNAYVAMQGLPLLKDGIRINAILPGPTDTPLARANADIWLGFGTPFREAAGGIKHLQPEEMGNALLFLCMPAASGINGVPLLVDQGQVMAAVTNAFPDPAISYLEGNSFPTH